MRDVSKYSAAHCNVNDHFSFFSFFLENIISVLLDLRLLEFRTIALCTSPF